MVSTVRVDSRVDAEAGCLDSTVIAPVAIERLVRRIARDHPECPYDAIEAAVVESLRQTDDARVHTFRLVLAERAARERLVRQPCSRPADAR